MSTPLPLHRRFAYWLETLAIVPVIWFVRLLPFRFANWLLAGLLGLIGPRTGKSRRARRNLELALPKLNKAEHKKIEKQMWRHIGHFLAEFIHLPTIYKQRNQRIEIENGEVADAALAQGKGVVAVGAHLSAWELLMIALHMRGASGATVYRPANNAWINRWMVKRRTRWTGFAQIPKYGTGMRSMLKLMRDKKTIGILADQRLSEGVLTNFFDAPAKTSHIPIKLAHRFGAPLLYGTIERLPKGRFRVRFHKGTEVPHSADEEKDILTGVQNMNDQLEQQIRADPANWLWTHNRWRL